VLAEQQSTGPFARGMFMHFQVPAPLLRMPKFLVHEKIMAIFTVSDFGVWGGVKCPLQCVNHVIK